MSSTEFRGIEDTFGKWVILHISNWPENLESPVTGLKNVEGKWLQFKLKGVDNFGVWLENPRFNVAVPNVLEEGEEWMKEHREALREAKAAYVLVKWEYVDTIIYLEGQKVDHIPLGFSALES